MSRKYFVALIIALIVIGVVVGSYVWSSTSQRPAFSPVIVQKGNIVETVRISGSVQPEVTAGLGFEKAGRITEIDAAVGDSVKAGQILAKIDDIDTQAQYAQAKAQTAQAQAVLEEYQQKVKADKYTLDKIERNRTGTYTHQDTEAQKKQIDADSALVSAQQAAVEAAQQNVTYNQIQVEKGDIIAPFSGIISAKNNEVGDVVASAAPVLALITGDSYKVEAYASEVDAGKIKPGDAADLSLKSDGNSQAVASQVVSIDPASVMQNGVPSYKVTLKFSGGGAAVKAGDSVDVTVTTAQANDALIVPKQDVIEKNGKDYITVSGIGLPELREIKTGIHSADGKVEIVSGLSAGDKILSVTNN
ncbi:MAG: efflux RND transporter periplasmic adaptor subunit [Candidatus Pacebacteria bacterium]|nr:efflux RND transporter periplasmic adaptor subunit [Candidatus Paceibacterota bacterium]MDR3583110.1 efflux RND transporter periplasmic adaptor subunit [Candidatus Paceibacterota bacterium]